MSETGRQELAQIVRPTNENELQGDDRLFRALVSGCHIENAAVAAGISERTAYRRLANREFRKQIDDARQSLRESILSRLADAGHDAIATLQELMQESDDDAIRVKAAKTLLDSLLATQKQESAPKKVTGNVSANVGSIAITVRNDDQSGQSLAIESAE